MVLNMIPHYLDEVWQKTLDMSVISDKDIGNVFGLLACQMIAAGAVSLFNWFAPLVLLRAYCPKVHIRHT